MEMPIDLASEAMRPAPQWHDLDADRTPKYIKVARELRTRIESGDWYPTGQCLPSSKSLATEFGVGREVILTALQVLKKAGYLRHVESKPHQVIWQASAPTPEQVLHQP
jgi:DNA-binding GntR family transcriptional regulator